jgi:hypothetical protein
VTIETLFIPGPPGARNQHSARIFRQMVDVIFTEGVIDPGGGSLAAVATGATQVTIAAGRAAIDGDDQANQGSYFAQLTTPEVVDLNPPPGANKRLDLVYLQVRDSDAGGDPGDDTAVLFLEGALHATTPVLPAVPDSAIPLCSVLRTAGDVALGTITDLRPTSSPAEFTTTSNFQVVATTAARNLLPNQYDGMTVYN